MLNKCFSGNKNFNFHASGEQKLKNCVESVQKKKIKNIDRTFMKNKVRHGKGEEAKKIKEELGEFDVQSSESYIIIIRKFGKSVRFSELVGIINTINTILEMKQKDKLPPITRSAKRSFSLLIKYIEDNKELILPFIQNMTLGNFSI